MRITTRKLIAVTTGLLLCVGVPALAQNTAAPAPGGPPPAASQGSMGTSGNMGTDNTAGTEGTMAPAPAPKKHTRHVRRHHPSSTAASTGAAPTGTEGSGSNMGAGSSGAPPSAGMAPSAGSSSGTPK